MYYKYKKNGKKLKSEISDLNIFENLFDMCYSIFET